MSIFDFLPQSRGGAEKNELCSKHPIVNTNNTNGTNDTNIKKIIRGIRVENTCLPPAHFLALDKSSKTNIISLEN